jgi:2-polyprenyl-6-methoxyphenol hydroxylase-like FAD-dependent oxidoreductase
MEPKMNSPILSHRPNTTESAQPKGSPRQCAVVLGGSLAGLLAAQVLSDHFAQVVVVDRDDLDTDLDAPRRGVPQSRHTHGLLVRGAEAMESILPGFVSGVRDRGGMQVDVLARSSWMLQDNVLTDGESGLHALLASRVLIESEVRRRVRETPTVRLLGEHDIVGLRTTADGRRVVGARVARRGAPVGASPDAARERGERASGTLSSVDLDADLVVDATGRGSRASTWLRELGYEAPEVTEVNADVTYVTRLFRSRPGVLDGLDAQVVGAHPPYGRAGVALRQEGDRWTVTLSGQHGEVPPSDLEGFLAYARTLPADGIAQIVEGCEPLGEPTPYRFPGSRWVRWERLRRRPEGFVVIGDAVCSFNPVYGQGMSSAAHQVVRLRALLAEGDPEGLARRSAKAFATVSSAPWALATGSDRRFPGMPAKPLPERLLDRYLDRLLGVATANHDVTVAFARVLNLLAAPPSLLAPRVVWRVLGPGSGRAARTARTAREARTTWRRQASAEATPPVQPRQAVGR